MRKFLAIFLLLLWVQPALAQEIKKEDPANPVVIMKTNSGNIHLELFKNAAPKTVANFIGLAEGTKEFTDPKTNKKTKRPYYDGLIFHRVIRGFMIQGGDPLGSGRGGPGFKFEDEINADHLGLGKIKKGVYENQGYVYNDKLKSYRPLKGYIAMANSGPNTNGSQFFINLVDTPHLTGKHTVFGKVIRGMDVVEKIGKTKVAQGSKPVNDVKIITLRLKK
jgi:peptidyl-prolyl cis-trans isomerase A (cyclophilin A)